MRLVGPRVVLRDFEDRDLEPWARWHAPGHAWQRFDGPYYPQPKPEDVARRVAELRTRIRDDAWPEPRLRLVVADRGTDALIGSVSRYWISAETQWAALGIDLYDAQVWGRGLGREALGLWCDYQFRSDPSLPRLDLRTWAGNERMMRLAERLGFTLEARHRDARVVDGVRCDALGYGILRAEWERRRPEGFA